MRYTLGENYKYCASFSELPLCERPSVVVQKTPHAVPDVGLVSTILGINDPYKASEALSYLVESANGYEMPSCFNSSQKAKLLALSELLSRNKPGLKIRDSSDIYNLVRHYAYSEQEHFGVVLLDGSCTVKKTFVITVGIINRTLVHPREAYVDALKERAVSVIFFHNHPSGTLSPSAEDLELTSRLKKAGNILGIDMMDHIIITTENYHSMKENGDFF